MDQFATDTDDAHPRPVIRIIIGDNAYKTVRWSLSNFVIDAYDGPLRPGDAVVVAAVAPLIGVAIPLETRARVVDYDARKWRLEAVMPDLDDRNRKILRGLCVEHNEPIIDESRLAG